MKKFLYKFFLLIVLFICLFAFAFMFGKFVIGNQYEKDYMASIIDKVSRLKSINEPKIILVGHSSLAFGMNSKMLQDADAINMPVVNLGLHGGLGNAFHEEIAKLNINSGDLVIVCHSSFADDDIISDNLLAWITLEYHKDLWPILRDKDYFKFIAAYPAYWIKSFILWVTPKGNKNSDDSSYSRKPFNEFGDVVFKPEDERSSIDKIFNSAQKAPPINDKCINRLNEYNKYIKSKGATLLIAGYPIGDGEFTPPAEEYDKFQRELESRLDCEVISNYRDYFIPYKYFYDSIFHLDEEGVKIRTQQLINDIQRWQTKQQNKTGNL